MNNGGMTVLDRLKHGNRVVEAIRDLGVVRAVLDEPAPRGDMADF